MSVLWDGERFATRTFEDYFMARFVDALSEDARCE